MKRKFILLLLSTILVFTMFPKNHSFAESNSLYRLEIADFLGEESVNNALQQLQNDTGWWAEKRLSRIDNYYRVSTGGFYGEEKVINVLNQFKAATGYHAEYKPLGEGIPYKTVRSGSYYGEDMAKKVAEEFTANTGIQATYQQNNLGKNKNRVLSGAYYGEDLAKSLIQELQTATGISAKLEPTGKYQEAIRVESGGFFGEETVKSVLRNFQEKTGIAANYEPIQYSEEYNVITGGFYGEDNVKLVVDQINRQLGVSAFYKATNQAQIYTITIPQLIGDRLSKVENYLKQNNWWYSKESTGVKYPTHYYLYTSDLYDQAAIQKALKFFQDNHWWATTAKTANKKYQYFNIVTESTLDSTKMNSALQFFSKKNFWATIETTNDIGYPYYDIVTIPLLDNQAIAKAESFYKNKGYWYTTQNTGEYDYSLYHIVTQDFLGKENQEKALKFFQDRGLWAESTVSGDAKFYKILTGAMSYEKAVAGKQMIADKYQWYSEVKEMPLPSSIVYSNINKTFDSILAIQSAKSPKLDGAGQFIASPALIQYYMNPSNFAQGSAEFYQFMDLTSPIDLNVYQIAILNKYLQGMGKLEGQAATFYNAGKTYGMNPIYLIAHAIHETGKGTSELSKGIQVNGQTVYNFFGYAAYDENANVSGSQYAYQQGWTTPEAAIIGGAANIAKNYIYRSSGPQNTLYKMRWNPFKPGEHQYATHVAWVTAQTRYINEMFQLLGSFALRYEVPVYLNQPGPTAKPTGEAQFAVLPTHPSLVGYTTTNDLTIRVYPNGNSIGQIPNAYTAVNVLGSNGGWYKVNANGVIGWVAGEYVDLQNAFVVTASALNVRSGSTWGANIIATLSKNNIVVGVVDANGNFVTSEGWYKVLLSDGRQGWVSGSYIAAK
ncbi:SH3 domain-containing protein [Caldibacillus thermoamylovorans]|nr:SH3 domain-containing protein [Caldibacillus thermoamylovorans]